MNHILILVAGLACVGLAAVVGLYLRNFARQVLESKRELQAVFDHVDPMAAIDLDLRILRCNRAFADLLGKEYHALLGRRIPDLLEDLWPTADLVGQAIEAGRRVTAQERRWTPPSGGLPRFADVHVFPVHGATKSVPQSAVVHLQDVTALACARRAAADASDRLRLVNEELVVRNAELKEMAEAISAEMETAREIQSALLPDENPQIPGLRIAVSYLPSRPVGGDIYDFLRIDEHRLGIFLADVSGHGLPAAFESAMVKMSFVNHARQCTSPAELFRRLNRELLRLLAAGHYVTAFYGILDLTSLEFTYCRASHPRPVLVRPGHSPRRLGSSGLFLGIVPDPQYQDSLLRLCPGDRLYVFTDGCYEGAVVAGRRIGYDGFIDLLAQHPAPSNPLTALDTVECEARMPSPDETDDRTFLAIDVEPDIDAPLHSLLERLPDDRPATVRTFGTEGRVWELVDELMTDLTARGWVTRERSRVQLTVLELAVNALTHGRGSEPGLEAQIAWSFDRSGILHVVVRDRGPGFDPESVPDPRDPLRRLLDHGRGIFLARRSTDDLGWAEDGRLVWFLRAPESIPD